MSDEPALHQRILRLLESGNDAADLRDEQCEVAQAVFEELERIQADEQAHQSVLDGVGAALAAVQRYHDALADDAEALALRAAHANLVSVQEGFERVRNEILARLPLSAGASSDLEYLRGRILAWAEGWAHPDEVVESMFQLRATHETALLQQRAADDRAAQAGIDMPDDVAAAMRALDEAYCACLEAFDALIQAPTFDDIAAAWPGVVHGVAGVEAGHRRVMKWGASVDPLEMPFSEA